MRYRIALALLFGGSLVSLLLFLIKILPQLALLLLPGAVIAHLIAESVDLGPPLLVFAANALIYSGVAYAGVSVFGRRVEAEKMRLATIRMALPGIVLVGLVCIPALNPLWPRGMTELTGQEKALQEALPVGMEREGARAVLRSKGIQFQEQTETSSTVLLERQNESITAAAGDRVISARLETAASQFPCGYDLEILLLFGRDDRMKEQYVHRLRVCP